MSFYTQNVVQSLYALILFITYNLNTCCPSNYSCIQNYVSFLAEYNNKSASIKCQTILLSVFFYLHPATIPFIICKEVVRVTNKIEAIDFVSLF